ncbi:hypothetical protein FAIPA1_380021 [Frankia sp. AiPs1]|uniref:hypothetical protein n=1 Tax=Frankia sp. AiPa1 TaxID=573492 RepID=UPI00202ACAEB|nr:hypothetical protein [Frankia sp. AiPa1]MCL9762968.1 hypothetical protein [Frankia sp. AiPa1]
MSVPGLYDGRELAGTGGGNKVPGAFVNDEWYSFVVPSYNDLLDLDLALFATRVDTGGLVESMPAVSGNHL